MTFSKTKLSVCAQAVSAKDLLECICVPLFMCFVTCDVCFLHQQTFKCISSLFVFVGGANSYTSPLTNLFSLSAFVEDFDYTHW